MPTLDATVGGASANAYISVADATTYFDNRLHTSAWTSATDDDKARALIMATTGLDQRVEWDGLKADTGQALAWPRQGLLDDDGYVLDDETLPSELTDVCCDYALALLGKDLTGLPDTAGIKSLKVDVIELEFDKLDRPSVVPDEIFAPIMKWAARRGNSIEVIIERA